MKTVLCWFRRDLRVRDHTALYHAARDGERVVPFFIVDPALMAPPHGGAPRVTFLLQSLHVLDENLKRLGGKLIVRQGDPVAEVVALLREAEAEAVYVNRDYIAPGLARDRAVQKAVEEAGFAYHDFKDLLLVEPDDLLTGEGKPYTVYTPYWRAWQRQPIAAPLSEPEKPLETPDLKSIAIPRPSDLGWTTNADIAAGGEDVVLALLGRFTRETKDGAPIQGYETRRNVPAEKGTSFLSPHLRFGTLSPRTALKAARDAAASARARGDAEKGAVIWESELAWREFYWAWMAHFPYVLEHPFDRRYDKMPYDDDDDLYDAWRHGQTGFPIVDAGMRQLNKEGWMHNRLRMITASFLTKDLLMDYRKGEAYFWEHLTCGDKPANMGGWQWSASVGTDAQPYFRVFNPVTQGERYDPTGAYVRRYVPELEALPDKHIHSPWTLPDNEASKLGFQLGKTYPAPIVDHAERRLRAIETFKAIRSS